MLACQISKPDITRGSMIKAHTECFKDRYEAHLPIFPRNGNSVHFTSRPYECSRCSSSQNPDWLCLIPQRAYKSRYAQSFTPGPPQSFLVNGRDGVNLSAMLTRGTVDLGDVPFFGKIGMKASYRLEVRPYGQYNPIPTYLFGFSAPSIDARVCPVCYAKECARCCT